MPPLIAIIASLGVSQIIAWGTVFYSFSLLAQDAILTTGVPSAGVYGAFSAGLITAGVLAPWVGVDRLGGRLVMGIGTLLLSAGFALVAWSPSLVIFCLAWQILGLAMPMTLHEPAFATLVQIAGAKRARLATTQLTLAAGFASTVFWPLTHVCDHQMGWRETYLFFAAANLIVSLPLHILILPPPSSSSELVSNPSEGETDRYSINPDFRHDRLAFLLVAFIFADNGFVFSGPSIHLLPVLQSFGLSVASGVSIAALIGPAQVGVRTHQMLFRLTAAIIGLTATGSLALGFLVLGVFGVRAATVSIFTLIYGVSSGLTTIARGVLGSVRTGPIRKILGKIAAAGIVASASTPLIFAFISTIMVRSRAWALQLAQPPFLLSP
jgi:MFS family permease